MHLVGMDFESYYDGEYSLTKMPTHQYIRDERWQELGCGFQIDEGEPFYVQDSTPIFRKLDALGWDNIIMVAHNASFDGSVLWERHGCRRPARWLDTQLIARWAVAQGHLHPDQGVSLAKLAPLVGMQKGNTWDAVHGSQQQLFEYGVQDVVIMMALLDMFLSRFKPPTDELDYMDMHVRMMTEPRLCLDEPLLGEAATVTPEDVRMHKLLRQDANMVGLLNRMGVEVEYKTTPKGKRKPALAKSDAFMQGLQEHENPNVALLASARLDANSNLTHNRARTMLNVGSPLPFPVLYYGAHTGRASGSDGYNMQNNPSGGVLRQAVTAPPGYKFVVGDSGQIEARGVGFQADDQRLLDVFRRADAAEDDRLDAYRLFGEQHLYRKPALELSDFERKACKAGMLGCGFGQGWRGLQRGTQAKTGLWLPDDVAKATVNAYREGFPRVRPWWKRLIRWATEDGELELLDGRKILYPDQAMVQWDEEDSELTLTLLRPLIFSKGPRGKRQRKKLWHGTCAENVTQANMRSVVFWQARGMRDDGIPVIGMSHDEVISLAREDEAQDMAEHMLRWLRTAPPFAEGLPLNGKVVICDNYAEAK